MNIFSKFESWVKNFSFLPVKNFNGDFLLRATFYVIIISEETRNSKGFKERVSLKNADELKCHSADENIQNLSLATLQTRVLLSFGVD